MNQFYVVALVGVVVVHKLLGLMIDRVMILDNNIVWIAKHLSLHHFLLTQLGR